MANFSAGDTVRLIGDAKRVGVATGKTRPGPALTLVQVAFAGALQQWIPEDQLELVPQQPESPQDLLRSGRLGRADDLFRALTHIRLAGRLANFIYSLEVTDTDFYAYQFKPVLKLLQSASTGILVADEVGLGKTIEAGLLWTELRSRYDLQRLLVLCPAMLRQKWARELRRRFGVQAQICDAGDLLDILKQHRAGELHEFAVVASVQGTRPSNDWDTRPTPGTRDQLARMLDDSVSDAPLVDLLIIDEAHYLRNPGTRSFEFGMLARRASQFALLLSATPVHLHGDDLFTLMQLVDEDIYNDRRVFNYIRNANAVLLNLRDRVLVGNIDAQTLEQDVHKARRHELLKNNQQLRQLADVAAAGLDLRDQKVRVDVASRLESANLFGYAMSRTRRRDVVEWRAVRQAQTLEVAMTEVEHEFYDRVTRIVRDYCDKHEQSEGFLLVMPQRQVASCLAAALMGWSQSPGDVAADVWEQWGIEVTDNDERKIGPVVEAIRQGLTEAVSLEQLVADDSKYRRLLNELRRFLKERPHEKVVLFSSFRATLKYLHDRLTRDGISCGLLVGGTADQQAIIDSFAKPSGPSLLLSSEVGSEGIDLQFAWVLINYDLPWNPMKVEQRIGRLDRLGQASQKVVIWNLVHAETIDERIYLRLLLRLGIFQRTIGDLEVVLGERIRELTKDLMKPGLTPTQEAELIDQTAIALENVRKHEEALEKEASSLVAYGDYILRQVNEARDLSRRVRALDVQRYVTECLRASYPGTRIQQDASDHAVTAIGLTHAAKSDLEAFMKRHHLRTSTALTRNDTAPLRCRFDERVKVTRVSGEEVVNQAHPLVRFTAESVENTSDWAYPAIAVRLHRSALPSESLKTLRPGTYALSVVRWVFEALRVSEQLWYGLSCLDGTGVVIGDDVERLVTALGTHGEDWMASSDGRLCTAAADAVEQVLTPRAWKDFNTFHGQIRAQNDDRATAQVESLKVHLKHQSERIRNRLGQYEAKGNKGLATVARNQLQKLEERIRREIDKIERKRQFSADLKDVAVGIVELHGRHPDERVG